MEIVRIVGSAESWNAMHYLWRLWTVGFNMGGPAACFVRMWERLIIPGNTASRCGEGILQALLRCLGNEELMEHCLLGCGCLQARRGQARVVLCALTCVCCNKHARAHHHPLLLLSLLESCSVSHCRGHMATTSYLKALTSFGRVWHGGGRNIKAMEGFVLCCPTDARSHMSALIDAGLKFIKFDPNFADEDMDEDGAEEGG
eukprot:1138678-Pelagomonas_calceolata.AAC.10